MTKQPSLAQVLAAEAVGTFILVLAGTGNVALALNGGTAPGVGLLLAALAHGLALCVIINIFGRISGAHFNPAVTIGLASIRRFPAGRVLPYIVAQFVGAIVAAVVIIAMYGQNAAKLAGAGSPALNKGISGVQGTVMEAVGAFILVLAIVAVAADTRFKLPEGWAGLVIGLALFTGIIIAGVGSGAGLNPAVGLGTMLGSAIFQGQAQGSAALVYLLGPIIGAVLAAYTYRYIAGLPDGPMTPTGQSKRI